MARRYIRSDSLQIQPVVQFQIWFRYFCCYLRCAFYILVGRSSFKTGKLASFNVVEMVLLALRMSSGKCDDKRPLLSICIYAVPSRCAMKYSSIWVYWIEWKTNKLWFNGHSYSKYDNHYDNVSKFLCLFERFIDIRQFLWRPNTDRSN